VVDAERWKQLELNTYEDNNCVTPLTSTNAMLSTELLPKLHANYNTKQHVVVVLLYGLVSTRLQQSKNIQSCIASQWKSNTDNKTLLLLKWNLHSIIHRKYKTHGKNISSKVCGCYMAPLTLIDSMWIRSSLSAAKTGATSHLATSYSLLFS